jgi:hypothetical protein
LSECCDKLKEKRGRKWGRAMGRKIEKAGRGKNGEKLGGNSKQSGDGFEFVVVVVFFFLLIKTDRATRLENLGAVLW